MISYRKDPILPISKHGGFNFQTMKLGSTCYSISGNFKELKTKLFSMRNSLQDWNISKGDLFINPYETGSQFALGFSQLDRNLWICLSKGICRDSLEFKTSSLELFIKINFKGQVLQG